MTIMEANEKRMTAVALACERVLFSKLGAVQCAKEPGSKMGATLTGKYIKASAARILCSASF